MIVMPSGRRSSDPGPSASASGKAPRHGGQRRHEDRTEAFHAGLANGLLRRQTPRPFGVEREVDKHDAVLLDDTDQQNDADKRDHRQVHARRAAAPAAPPGRPTAGWK